MTDLPENVRMSPDALRDLEDILAYSLLTWGETQMRGYAQRLHRGIARIARFPEIGRLRPELGTGVRTLPVEGHIVIYTVRAEIVIVIRLLSHFQDLDAALASS
ncbi:MAG: type II toxin-antitoxin system RelE/ParE family toxin [Thermomicrobiales bacterium]